MSSAASHVTRLRCFHEEMQVHRLEMQADFANIAVCRAKSEVVVLSTAVAEPHQPRTSSCQHRLASLSDLVPC